MGAAGGGGRGGETARRRRIDGSDGSDDDDCAAAAGQGSGRCVQQLLLDLHAVLATLGLLAACAAWRRERRRRHERRRMTLRRIPCCWKAGSRRRLSRRELARECVAVSKAADPASGAVKARSWVNVCFRVPNGSGSLLPASGAVNARSWQQTVGRAEGRAGFGQRNELLRRTGEVCAARHGRGLSSRRTRHDGGYDCDDDARRGRRRGRRGMRTAVFEPSQHKSTRRWINPSVAIWFKVILVSV